MSPLRGLSWGGGRSGILAIALCVALMAPATLFAPAAAATTDTVSVIVRGEDGASTDALTAAVAAVGGEVTLELGLIGGVAAEVAAGAVTALVAHPAVASVVPDGRLVPLWGDHDEDDERDHDDEWERDNDYRDYYDTDSSQGDDAQGNQDDGDMDLVSDAIGADDQQASGYDGSGVDVALIDTGVSPVPGLTGNGKVVNGPDLSFDSQNPDLRYLDGDGHGTHLAGIIAGNHPDFSGVAPGARIVNVKVGDHDGVVDVSQVIAAIDWVVQHRNSNGLNIRVLNLAFGTDSTQSYRYDPLSFAVEQAWQRGIVVVVAAGNDGNDTALRMPAANPYVIAVGASETRGTPTLTDDRVPSFSNCGTDARSVDLVAPGKSIQSLRVPNSLADQDYPGARVGDDKFKGSGTSQSAAVVSGAAALLLDRYPYASPDEIKARLTGGATRIDATDRCQGAGSVNLASTGSYSRWRDGQDYRSSRGEGSLHASRGSAIIEYQGEPLTGERDIFGNRFDAEDWAEDAEDQDTWDRGRWNGVTWSGVSWSGVSWSGVSWSGVSWSGVSWSGVSWSGVSWSGMTWSNGSWTGTGWTGDTWSSVSWSTNGWTG